MAATSQETFLITKEILQHAVANENACALNEVEVLRYKTSEGSKKGENFLGVLVAAEVEAQVKGGIPKTYYYMVKCVPNNPYRADYLQEVI